MRPTTTDIAKVASVSLATVDRVLNERPGVAERTVAKVNNAIKELGYVRDVSAANLAKGRQYNLVFVLPDDNSEFLSELSEEIQGYGATAKAERTDLSILKIPAADPHQLVTALRSLDRDKVDGVAIMARATPQSRDAIAELGAAGIASVAFISHQPDSEVNHFIGIDNVAAGRTAGKLMGRFLPQKQGQIAVITNSIQSYDSLDRRHGFDEVINNEFPHLRVLPTIEGHGNTQRIYEALEQIMANYPDVYGIYSMSSGNRAITEFLTKQGKQKDISVIVHELTQHSRSALATQTIDAVITQNKGHIVRSAIRVLRAKSDQVAIDARQERIRIDIVLKENLPTDS